MSVGQINRNNFEKNDFIIIIFCSEVEFMFLTELKMNEFTEFFFPDFFVCDIYANHLIDMKVRFLENDPYAYESRDLVGPPILYLKIFYLPKIIFSCFHTLNTDQVLFFTFKVIFLLPK